MNDDITLDSLVGEHVLDAVDTFVERVEKYGSTEDASAIRFRLDGIAYTALEDPSDGYHSAMERIFTSPADKVVNVFPPIRVIARKKADDRYGNSNDTLELIDVVTGKVVLEVGTDDSDDYYPSFISAFWPENMASNDGKVLNTYRSGDPVG